MKSHNSENIQKADIIKVNKKRVVILFFESKKRRDQRTSRGGKHCEKYGTSGKSTPPPQKKIPPCGTLPIKAFGRDYIV